MATLKKNSPGESFGPGMNALPGDDDVEGHGGPKPRAIPDDDVEGHGGPKPRAIPAMTTWKATAAPSRGRSRR